MHDELWRPKGGAFHMLYHPAVLGHWDAADRRLARGARVVTSMNAACGCVEWRRVHERLWAVL